MFSFLFPAHHDPPSFFCSAHSSPFRPNPGSPHPYIAPLHPLSPLPRSRAPGGPLRNPLPLRGRPPVRTTRAGGRTVGLLFAKCEYLAALIEACSIK